MKRVAVLMGGVSAEREISLVTGREVAKGLTRAGYEVVAIEVGGDLRALIAALEPKPDAVFNALHGRYGEDGHIQALLDLLRIPYTHSGLLASALAMDKPTAKRLFAGAGIRCPEGLVVDRAALRDDEIMPRPYVVKPVNEGSSVGVRIYRPQDNQSPREFDFSGYGAKVLVEPYVPGRELTVGVMGERALTVTELRPRVGFYDYEAKYTAGKTEHVLPAPVAGSVFAEAMRAARLAHETLGCRGVSRADFRLDDTRGGEGELYLLEINTQPGMTPLSLLPEQAAHCGIPFEGLVSWMVENAQCDA